MSDADRAYKAAQALIEEARKAGVTRISFDTPECHALTHIPTEIASLNALTHVNLTKTSITDLGPLSTLTRLQSLDIARTGVTDLAPLTGLTDLRTLWLNQTGITDLRPLTILTKLEDLILTNTRVIDLRPLRALDKLGSKLPPGLTFRYTLAVANDAELARLAMIKDTEKRARDTLTYLRSLPPWPEPYTPRATPEGSPPQPVGGGADNASSPKARTSEAQIRNLLRHALVTRVTAAQLSEQITNALRDVPATHGNELAPPLQMMADLAEVLSALAQDDIIDADHDHDLRLRIHHLEAIIERLTQALKDEQQACATAEALAKKDGFWQSYRRSLGIAAGAGTIGVISVGVPTAAVYFLGPDHPLVQAFLTVLGRLPKG